jgi:alanyl-tRNA synthetase
MRLRFDFSHTGPLTEEELEAVERTVNEQIMEDQPVEILFSSYDEAIHDGVTALFGEKYEDRVRRIRVPGFSEELCGGTHVARTGQIGSFTILSETGVAAGVRRIEAITGTGAVEARLKQKRIVERVRRALQGAPEEIPERLTNLLEEHQRLKKEINLLRTRGSQDELAPIWDKIQEHRRGKLLVTGHQMEDTRGIRELGDLVRDRLRRGIGLVAIRSGAKTTLLAVVTDDLIDEGVATADAIVREAAQLGGGSGGGKAHLAMAGIQDPSKIPEILETIRKRLVSLLTNENS